MKKQWRKLVCPEGLFAAVLLLEICLTIHGTPPPIEAKNLPKIYQANEHSYVRTVQSAADTFTAQTASRLFRRAGSPDIELVGAIHIGEPSYYSSLQQRLNRVDLVLYEQVTDQKNVTMDRAAILRAKTNSAYYRLASAMGLTTQSHAMDVQQRHFRRCDMTFSQMMARLEQEAQGGNTAGEAADGAKKELATLHWILSGGSRIVNGIIRFASMHQGFCERMRFQLVAKGADSDGPASLHPRLHQLILQDRNAFVLSELEKVLREEKHRSIAIFYGAAHLPGMEEHLLNMGYRAASAREWTDVLVSRPYAAGISSAAVQKMLGIKH